MMINIIIVSDNYSQLKYRKLQDTADISKIIWSTDMKIRLWILKRNFKKRTRTFDWFFMTSNDNTVISVIKGRVEVQKNQTSDFYHFCSCQNIIGILEEFSKRCILDIGLKWSGKDLVPNKISFQYWLKNYCLINLATESVLKEILIRPLMNMEVGRKSRGHEVGFKWPIRTLLSWSITYLQDF